MLELLGKGCLAYVLGCLFILGVIAWGLASCAGIASDAGRDFGRWVEHSANTPSPTPLFGAASPPSSPPVMEEAEEETPPPHRHRHHHHSH